MDNDALVFLASYFVTALVETVLVEELHLSLFLPLQKLLRAWHYIIT